MFPRRFGRDAIAILGPELKLHTIPFDEFIALRNENAVTGDMYPLPDGATGWFPAVVCGDSCMLCETGIDLYLIYLTDGFGPTLYHYLCTGEKGREYERSYDKGVRALINERSKSTMAIDLMNLAQQSAQQRNLVQNPQGLAQAPGDAISVGVDPRKLQKEALQGGYVAGYIMGTAPAITVSLYKKKSNTGDTFNITARESKPGRLLRVLIALPANCVKKGGSVAAPGEVAAGHVDFTTESHDLIKMACQRYAAIGYLYAVGGRLPEYAPHVTDMREHWSKEAILNDNPEVTYVILRPAARPRNSSTQGRFRFNLKSTALSRRSLYTQKNVVCLRALEHMPVPDKDDKITEEESYRLNESAFRNWKATTPKGSSENILVRAINHCPSQIWEKKYTINGTEVNGIGSVFFMSQSSETDDGGQEHNRVELTYFPWYETGDKKSKSPSKVRSMVKRSVSTSKTAKEGRLVTTPILYKDDPDHEAFKPYRAFADFVVSQGYMTADKLMNLGSRTTKASRRKVILDSTQIQDLQDMLKLDEWKDQIREVQEEADIAEILAR